MSSNVTDFFLKKAPKVKITDALIFYCFVFVTRYLTSSRPAAPTLFYQKPTQKKCRKINKLKKFKKMIITASGFLDLNFLSSHFWNQEEFFFSPLLILFFCLQTFAFLRVRTNARLFVFVFGPRRSN